MSFVGVVSKGTVVLPPDANLPDGTEVRVEALPAKPLSERLSDVIGIVHGGPPDLADRVPQTLGSDEVAALWLPQRHLASKPGLPYPEPYGNTSYPRDGKAAPRSRCAKRRRDG